MPQKFPPRHQIIANLVEAITVADFYVLCARNEFKIHEIKTDRSTPFAAPKQVLGNLVAVVHLTEQLDDLTVTVASKSDLVTGLVKGVCAPRYVHTAALADERS